MEKVSSYRWVVYGLWSVVGVSGMMVVLTLGILLPAISDDLDLSPGEQGLLGSAAFWGNLALTVPMSLWTSRYGPKILTTVTLILGTLLLFLQGWAPFFGVLILGRVAFGITLLAREPARALLIEQWFSPREVVVANAVAHALFGLVVGGGLLVVPFIFGVLGDDWRASLYVFGGLFAVLTLLWMVLGKERVTREYQRRTAPRESGLLKGALMHRDLWASGFGFLGATLARAAFLAFFPTLMLETHDVSLRWSGGILALAVLIGGGAGLVIGYVVMLMDKRKGILQVLGILMAGTYVGMTLTDSISLLVALAFVNGIAWGFWPILISVPFQLPGIRPREIAVGVAFSMTMVGAGTTLGPLLVGYLQEALDDLRLSLLIAGLAALALSVAGAVLRFSPQEREPEPSEVAYQG